MSVVSSECPAPKPRLSACDSALIVATGGVGGSLYYVMMSASLPTDSNCSFSANYWTDILAFVVGFGLVFLGLSHGSRFAPSQLAFQAMLLVSGVAIVTEHVWQLVDHKV